MGATTPNQFFFSIVQGWLHSTKGYILALHAEVEATPRKHKTYTSSWVPLDENGLQTYKNQIIINKH